MENIPSSFDQLCINYVNESVQQFFVQRILCVEKEWYDKESIDVPFVPFFDNCVIIGTLHFSLILKLLYVFFHFNIVLLILLQTYSTTNLKDCLHFWIKRVI